MIRITYLIVLLFCFGSGLRSQSTNLQWVDQFGGSLLDATKTVTTDMAGNVYISGAFRSTVDFDPGPGVYNLTASGGCDAFVVKLSTNGGLIWAKKFGGSLDDGSNAICVDGSGNVYCTGTFENIADFDPGPGIYNITSGGFDNCYISKLDVNGNFIWAKAILGPSFVYGYSLALDFSNNVLVTGYFFGSADLDPGSTTYNVNSAGNFDAFIVKLDMSGNFLWGNGIGGTQGDYGASVTTDLTGNVFLTGNFLNTVDFDPGVGTFTLNASTSNVFVLKLDPLGNFIFALQIGVGLPYCINLDNSGDIIVTGHFLGTGDFDPGSGIYNLTSTGGRDVFVSKLDPSGNFLWAKQIGGTLNDEGNSIAIDATGDIYVAGYFQNTTDMDPGPGITTYTSFGGSDGFILRMDANGNYLWSGQFGGSLDENVLSVTLDSAGDIYSCGFFKATCDFDPSPSTYNLTSAGDLDVFVNKLCKSCNVGLTNTEKPNNFSIYPNPASDKIKIQGIEINSCTLFSIDGKEIPILQNSKNEIDVSAVSQGIYFLQVHTSDGILTRKIIIQH